MNAFESCHGQCKINSDSDNLHVKASQFVSPYLSHLKTIAPNELFKNTQSDYETYLYLLHVVQKRYNIETTFIIFIVSVLIVEQIVLPLLLRSNSEVHWSG